MADAVVSLRFGDRVFLEFVDFNGDGQAGDQGDQASQRASRAKTWLIEGQGFFNDDLAVVSCPPPSADECLFQICPRSRVSAAEDYAMQCAHRTDASHVVPN